MILKSDIETIVRHQADIINSTDAGLRREALSELPELSGHALIITGIRRCGKSTLLYQMIKDLYPDGFYLNFDDNRLYGFENNDFRRLDDLISGSGKKILFFDEIQVVDGWERYVRQKLDEKYKVVITGSNASMLSHELGTKLTGRHISKELFPFSYREFLQFTGSVQNENSFSEYMSSGGFPEFLKQNREEILSGLFDDILIRDIVVRYGIRDIKGLQNLALLLISNPGTLVTAGKLKQTAGISATSTVLEYFSHFSSSYLFNFIPKFSYSIRSQMTNPRKVYAADTGLITANSLSFSGDKGRRLENIVHNHIRAHHTNIFYWSEKNECDFVVIRKGKKPLLLQVCYDLNMDNLDREIAGITEAARFFTVKEGTIITFDQSDKFSNDGIRINAVPAGEFLTGKMWW